MHASTINVKSSHLPSEWKAAFEEFQKQIGYRFVLKKLEYPSQVNRGAMIPVNMWWFNAGIAPVYRSYVLALEIGSAVVPLDADVRQWLPGDLLYENTVPIPHELKPGKYAVRVRLLDPRRRKQRIRL